MQGKSQTSLLVTLLVISVILGSFSVSPSFSSQSNVQVGLFYYVWYTGKLGEGHWNGSLRWTVVDEPLLGYYDSSNSTVIRQHLEWFKELGINFLVISWWGPNSFEDNVTKAVFSMAEQCGYPIQIAIMVEAYNWSGAYDFKAIYDYVNSTYVAPYGSIYMKLNGLPLVCFWNDNINMTATQANRDAMHNVSGFSARIVGQSSYVDWYGWQPCSVDSDETPVINSNDGVVVIEPRYDGSYIGQGAGSVFDPTYSQGLYDSQWNNVLQNTGKIKYVLIYSWNEYYERSQIEPHVGLDGKCVLLPFCKTYDYVQAIPTVAEFQTFLALPLLVIPTLLVATVYKRKPKTKSD